jgi:hypothetical protein
MQFGPISGKNYTGHYKEQVRPLTPSMACLLQRVWRMLARKRYVGHSEAQVKSIWQQVPRL